MPAESSSTPTKIRLKFSTITAIRFMCGIDEAEDNVAAQAFFDDLELATCSP
jgi:hypothetical protein